MAESLDIKAIRSKLGETQAAFAERFGVDQATVHRWETKGIPENGTARIVIEQFLSSIDPAEPERAAQS